MEPASGSWGRDHKLWLHFKEQLCKAAESRSPALTGGKKGGEGGEFRFLLSPSVLTHGSGNNTASDNQKWNQLQFYTQTTANTFGTHVCKQNLTSSATACMSPPAKPWVKPCLRNHTWRCCSGFRVRFDLQAYLKQLWVSRYHSLQEDVFGDGYHLLDPILENWCKLFFFNDNLLQNLCAYSSKKTFWPPACLIYYFLFFLKFGILIGIKQTESLF